MIGFLSILQKNKNKYEEEKMKTVRFYTLLYIDTENQSLSVNGISGTFDQQMKTFIKCCETLNESLLFFTNYQLTVLTNNKAYIECISTNLTCIEIAFDFKVPKDTGFTAAHRKIDAYKYLAQSGDSDYSFLIDSDVLCLSKMPLNLINCISNNIPVYYDITEQVYPAYSREKIIKDKEVLMSNQSSTGIWAGGEFIGGDNKFFKLLHDEIEILQENYFNNYKDLHHQGDEALVSPAIEKIMHNQYICNVGSFGGIGRFWSVPTLHVQSHWKSYTNNFLLHLPADKDFIAGISSVDEHLINLYESYLKTKRVSIMKYSKKIIKKLLNK